ncbi:PHA/PHB synthase family protein [Dankookia sp. P2]|uniref:PHA/PHB synthase family protein n=1 Tax=Dankookia sp. P2 TaxID=3423955 RepID=UPI003D67453D
MPPMMPGVQGAGALSDAAVAEALRQAKSLVDRDPLLKSVDAMWNANPMRDVIPVDWAEVARALRIVWLQSFSDPAATIASATALGANVFRAALEAWGKPASAGWERRRRRVEQGGKPAHDKRFAAPEWQANPVFRTLKEAYLLASDWLVQRGKTSPGLDAAERQRLEFHLRQFVDAMSPTLLLASNPVALKRAMETGGASLANGARNLMEDLQAGRLSMVDENAFAPGRNLALTPGKVVHRNKLVELLQYTPQTPNVHARPLLILPPWINKFYIMDMQPKNSLVDFLVKQGFTVFVVSWRNPDASMEDTTIEDYMDLGVLETSDVVRDITGSETLNVMGYCIGGTLLAMVLAWLAAEGDKRFNAVTFMVSLQDFSRVGDTAIFLGDGAIDAIEAQMMQRGYLDSREMANMFNLLRSNDLIWANVVNNYLLGEKPPAFDLLYWNSDGTRMARAAHAWYLRNTYVENNLMVPGRVVLKGQPLDLGAIRQDIYAVGAEKDHIVPWDAACADQPARGRQGTLHPRLLRPYRRGHQPRRAAREATGHPSPAQRPRALGARCREA